MKGWKTVIFNIAAAILPALEAIDMTDVLGSEGMSIYALVITIANVVLRFFTKTPVGQKV